MQVIVLPLAEVDLEEILDRIEVDLDLESGLRYVRRIRALVEQLATTPYRGTPWRDDYPTIRTMPSHDRRYTIYFEVDEQTKCVLVRRILGGGIVRDGG